VTRSGYSPETIAAAGEVADLVEGYVPRLSSRSDLVPRHFAAASLARANRLLCGIRKLTDNDLDDVSGVLLRALIEVWMVGLYLLYGGRGAFEHVGGAYVRSLTNLAPDAFPTVQAMVDEWKEFDLPANRIKYEDLAPKIGDLLEAAGGAQMENRATMQAYYEILYRGSSLVDAHAGLSTMAPHVVSHEDRMDVSVKRRQHGDRHIDLVTAAALVGHLAWHVLREFGFSTAQVDEALAKLPSTPYGL
jgi:Family of unknown function (DUF5677)